MLFILLVTPIMELKPNCGSDRAWVWNTFSDFSDGDAHSEILAIKFINAESESNKFFYCVD